MPFRCARRPALDPSRGRGDIPVLPPGRIALTEPKLHIAFSDVGADALRGALKFAGRRDEIVSLPDDLSLGPIAAVDARAVWFECELDLARNGRDVTHSEFWSAALRPGRRRVAWWSWRVAREHCGFLEFVSRLDGGPCDAIDLGDAPLANARTDTPWPARAAETLALLLPEQIAGGGLLDRAEPLAADARAVLRQRWSRLRAEDAPLRVPTGGAGIVSAPLSFFDEALLRCTTDRWGATARTIAEVLADSWETRLYRAGDLLLAARVHALAAAGRIELRGGDPRPGLAGTELRLPGRRAAP